jgi:uncharacterized OB-fold protein
MSRPIPTPDLITAPYWNHVSEGKFALPRCESCGRYHFYPHGACPHCGGTQIAWTEASGRGEVYSFSVVHRAPGPAFKDDVPYVVAIVKTEEGPHLLSRVVGVPPDAVKIGMRLKVKVQKIADGPALPVFEAEES